MTLWSALALFGSMSLLAMLPSVSTLAVCARAASHGVRHGALTAAGIVTADLILIGVAVFGLALLMQVSAEAAPFIRYLGGFYLAVTGISLWRANGRGQAAPSDRKASASASFLTGLLITLADQKAVLFYLGLLPVFLDLSAITTADIFLLLALTALSVGGVKLAYARFAGTAGGVIGTRNTRLLNRLSAVILVTAALYLLWK